MSIAELQELEEVKGLITRGQRVGVLTYAEIETATAELGLDETDVDELHGLFERSEIELVEEIDPATAASLNLYEALLVSFVRRPTSFSTGRRRTEAERR
jgi:Sigma-70 factor, region 1.1